MVNSLILFQAHRAEHTEIVRLAGYWQCDFRDEIVREIRCFEEYGDPLLIHKVSLKRKRKPSHESKKKIKKMKIQKSNLSTTASVPLDCEAERGKTSAPAGREKKQKTTHERKIQESNLSTTASVPLDCEAENGETSTPACKEKKQKTSHEVKATSQLPCNLGE